MTTKEEICHVCNKEKNPYTVIITNNMMSMIDYDMAR